MDYHPLNRGRWARGGSLAAILSLAAGHAAALGLGRLAVQSALGEPLRAEIEVTSLSPEEAAGLQIRVAAPDAFRAAGIEYNAVLSTARAVLQRRPDGRQVLRLASDRVVQEPFVEVILDVSWPSGQLVRGYTMLFDPPSQRSATTAPMTAPVFSAASPAPQRAATAAAGPAASPALPPAPPPPGMPGVPLQAAAQRRAAPAPQSAAADATVHTVQPGETLSTIAERTQPPGVSLDQMLAALYRGNADAFIDRNINRLRSGAVLKMPRSEAAAAISPEAARRTIQGQSADFGAYRQRLATAVPETPVAPPARQASGRVQGAIADAKTSTTAAPDQLRLSKDAGTGTTAALAAAADALASLQRERRDAETRIAALTRTIEELKALSAQGGSAARAAPADGGPAGGGPGLTNPLSSTPPPAPEAAASPAAPALAAASAVVPPVVPAASAQSDAASAPEAATSAAVAAQPASAPRRAAVPEPMPEPSFLSALVDDGLYPVIVGLLLVGTLLGYGAYRMRRRKSGEGQETSFFDSHLKADSFFAASGGQRIDTRESAHGALTSGYSLSQLDAGGDVDPVAEADVYLAYGRDLQAEEILKEALRATPDRLPIRTKLLEVYAKRRDTKGFEVLAIQLYALTAGKGEDWQQAQQMGLALEPDNALYAPGGTPMLASDDESPLPLPFAADTQPQTEPPPELEAGAVDIDLDFGDAFDAPAGDHGPDVGPSTQMSPIDVHSAAPMAAGVSTTLTPQPVQSGPVADPHSLDFALQDMDFAAAAPAAPAAVPTAAVTEHDVDFGLPDLSFAAEPPSAPRVEQPMTFDLSGISLDLTPTPAPPAAAPAPAFTAADLDLEAPMSFGNSLDFFASNAGDPLAAKFELAEELAAVGDEQGARDLLVEVIAEAEGELKAKAEALLAIVS